MKKPTYSITVWLLAAALLLSSCSSPGANPGTGTPEGAAESTTEQAGDAVWSTEVVEGSAFVLGTVVSVRILTNGTEALLEEALSRLKEIEAAMSVNIPESDVSRINAAAEEAAGEYSEPVAVGRDVMEVVKTGIRYGELSGGAFDISFGPIIDLWQIGTEEEHIPSDEAIAASLPLVDYRGILLDEAAGTIAIRKGMKLDLGGIAKGYAADEVDRILEEAGVTQAIINLGGNVKILGEKEGGDPFKVGIQNPNDDRNTYAGIVSVKDMTVVTSGDYERYFEKDGVRYHHIFDKETGRPKVTDVKAVSVVTERSIDADALSTILFVMEPEEGIRLADSLEGVACIYVTKDQEIHLSREAAGGMFKLTDDRFRLATIQDRSESENERQ